MAAAGSFPGALALSDQVGAPLQQEIGIFVSEVQQAFDGGPPTVRVSPREDEVLAKLEQRLRAAAAVATKVSCKRFVPPRYPYGILEARWEYAVSGFPRYARDQEGTLWQRSQDVWQHIAHRHPEVIPYAEQIEATLRDPDEMRRSRKKLSTWLYYRRLVHRDTSRDSVSARYVCVVVDSAEGEVKTTYLTDRIKQGEVRWRRD